MAGQVASGVHGAGSVAAVSCACFAVLVPRRHVLEGIPRWLNIPLRGTWGCFMPRLVRTSTSDHYSDLDAGRAGHAPGTSRTDGPSQYITCTYPLP